MKSLSAGKSSRGEIPTSILKECIDSISKYLTDCLNAFVDDSNFPGQMKLVDIISVFKKDVKTDTTIR